uniref:Ig-like domain-containing protein n=1 Tax=Labrus bergylta TaxID=56723 RepID=A0A3Q3E4D4_9LABR
MMNQALIKAFLLCSLSWISVSSSESQTVEVQSGEDVTLMCSGMDENLKVRYWLKVVKGADIQCVSAMTNPTSTVRYHDGFSNHTFTMSSNTSTIFLKVRSVDLNKSGIYYCGFNKDGHPFLTTIHLKIKGSNEYSDTMIFLVEECDGAATLVSMILGGLTLLLVMVVIGLGAKIRKLQTAAEERQNPGHTEVNTTQFTSTQFASDELNYAAVTFRSKAKRREPEPNVLYGATR